MSAITTSQLDVIERRAHDYNETDLSLVPVECSAVIRLVAIARAALAWGEADRRLTNASYSIGDYDSAQVMVRDALDGIRTALRGAP